MRVSLVLLLVSACGFPTLTREDPSGGGGSGGTDAGPIPLDAQLCYGSILKVCFANSADVPTAPVTLPSSMATLIDTDVSVLCNKANNQSGNYCVVVGTSLTLQNTQTLRSFGSKPLVLLSTGTMDIEGTVDVSSARGPDQSSAGAGANPSACVAGTLAAGAGGGYGGSFGGKGGAGETITGNTNPGAGAGGTPADALTAFPTTLRGGCAGSIGGGLPSEFGTGGNGGGAIALIASQLILNGTINASGSGGTGGPATTSSLIGGSGGGGGGSGGMIIIDVDTTKIGGSGIVFANGGGGGAGGAPGAGHGGDDGLESSGPFDTPKGGLNSGARDGGEGGDGTSGTSLNGKPGSGSKNLGGGGGGGGGAGFVHAPGLNAANVSPPSQNPS